MTTKTQKRDSYHHGDLPKTLIEQGSKLLAEMGVEKFSMRELARRAGVAVAAPAHHFGNINGLYTAIAAGGFQILCAKMEVISKSDIPPEDQAILMCKAYVDLGKSHPGHSKIMVRLDLLDETNLDLQMSAFRAFGYLIQALGAAMPAGTDQSVTNKATRTLWATMHGMIALENIDDLNPDELIDFAVKNLLKGMRQA